MAKAFAWSFSKIKNYETCPKRHYEVDIAKTFKDEDGEALLWGNKVHATLAEALKKGTPLPPEMAAYQKWIDRVKAGPGELYVEQKYAITKSLTKTEWFSPIAWYRGIGDVVRVYGPVALILDWKTGKVLEDSVQLGLMAQCIFAHFPQVKRVRSEYIWLKEDCTTPEIFDRADMLHLWTGLLPRVKNLEQAAKTQTYPPKPSYLCQRFCPVQSCPYWGKKSQ